jgi:hypothetical protein
MLASTRLCVDGVVFVVPESVIFSERLNMKMFKDFGL